MGMYGQDSTWELINKVIQRAKSEEKKRYSAVFVSGDFIFHDFLYGKKYNLTEGQKLDMMHTMWNKTYELLNKTFPNRPIVSTFGNNDFTTDMLPPLHKPHKEAIYGFLAKLWFKDLTTEARNKILPSFNNGGYYVQDLETPKGLSVLALNSIYFNSNINSSYYEICNEQIKWLGEVLKNNSELPKNLRRQYVLMQHVPFGLNYYKEKSNPLGVQRFLNGGYERQILGIIKKYQDQIIINLASHIHRTTIKAPYSYYPELDST